MIDIQLHRIMWFHSLPFSVPLSPDLCQRVGCLSSTGTSLSTIVESIFFLINPFRTLSLLDILFSLIASRLFEVLVGVLVGALSRAYKGLSFRNLSAKLQKLEKVPISKTEKEKRISTGIFVYAWVQVAEIFKQLRRGDMMLSFYLTHFFLLWLHVSRCAARQNVFQVYQPVLTMDEGSIGCSEDVLLMNHVFSSSYGKPFVGRFENHCQLMVCVFG